MKEIIDHIRTAEITCPYCGWRDKDSWESGLEESPVEYECGECEKVFIAWREVKIDYSTTKKIEE